LPCDQSLAVRTRLGMYIVGRRSFFGSRSSCDAILGFATAVPGTCDAVVVGVGSGHTRGPASGGSANAASSGIHPESTLQRHPGARVVAARGGDCVVSTQGRFAGWEVNHVRLWPPFHAGQRESLGRSCGEEGVAPCSPYQACCV